jgi:adenine phosphoribosyltransferase
MATDYRSLIRDIPDFPQAGIMFRDITPLLGDAEAYQAAIKALAEPFRDAGIDQVAAIEARGYMLGCPLAIELGAGFVPVRKVGKLPFETYKAEYALEYGEAAIEVHRDGMLAHHKVLLIDDVLATGGTMAATINLVEQSGAMVAGVAVLIELTALGGRKALGEQGVFSLVTI